MKKSLKLILAIALVLTILPMVNAAITVETPIANSNHTTSLDIYVKYVNGSADMTDALAVNTTCYYNASGTWATVGTLSSFDINATGLTATIDISALTDSVGLSFNCSVGNDSDSTASDTIDGITFDSTSPVCSLVVQHPKIPYKGIQLLTWSVTDAVELVSNAEAVDGPQDQTNLTYTTAVKELTLVSTDTAYTGDWLATITGTDRAGNICTASETWSSYMPGEIGEVGVAPEKKYTAIFVIGVIAVIAFLVLNKKK